MNNLKSKTTWAGIAALLVVVGTAIQQYISGGIGGIQWEVLVTGVVAGIGLILAKDFNVSNAPNPLPASQNVSTPPAFKG